MIRWINIVARGLFWTVAIMLTLLLTINALPYFGFDPEHSMLGEKPEGIKSTFYLGAFYLHVAAGLLCLSLAPLLFVQQLLTKGVHKTLGKVFAYNTLLVLVPTGIYLSLYAKGGLTSTLSFSLLGVLLAYSILKGIGWIRKGNLIKHKEWMIRTYALAASALTFRLFHIALLSLSQDYIEVYLASVNLSLVANLLIAEVIIEVKRVRLGHKALAELKK